MSAQRPCETNKSDNIIVHINPIITKVRLTPFRFGVFKLLWVQWNWEGNLILSGGRETRVRGMPAYRTRYTGSSSSKCCNVTPVCLQVATLKHKLVCIFMYTITSSLSGTANLSPTSLPTPAPTTATCCQQCSGRTCRLPKTYWRSHYPTREAMMSPSRPNHPPSFLVDQ